MKNPKKINVAAALDSFKGSLTSREAGEAVRRGVLSRIPDAVVSLSPVGDGGEGTADALCAALCAERRFVTVSDTHGEPVRAEFGLYARDGVRTAVFDMAACCGLRFAKSHGLDYARSTTRGVGEMIRHALDLGCREIAVGLGGSGTGDGGIGALAALGARFTDRGGQEIADPRTKDLGRVAAADLSDLAIPPSVRLTLLCDTGVPLNGECGAVRMYARQKGAPEEEIPQLAEEMERFSAVCDRAAGSPVSALPGSGAAGGLGYGLTLAGGQITPGAPYVLRAVGFSSAAPHFDLVITGEGRTDAQTATGKLPMAVARAVRDAGNPCPVVCLCGIDDSVPALYEAGMDAVFAIADRPMTAEESFARTAALLEKAAGNVAAAVLAARRTTE